MAQQHTLLLSPSEAPAIRCKTCKVPLPDATRKNCERCRRNRTERFNRWKISVEAKKNLISFPTPVTHPSPAPSLNVNIRWMKPATTSAACSQPSHQSCPGSGMPSSAPLDPYLNEHQAATSHRPKDTPRLMSSLPRDIDIPEYQWGEELVDTLLALPPRSNFFGKFSVIADPDVDNSKRAQMFLDQIRSEGLPTSDTQKHVSGNPDSPCGRAISLYCKCEVGCQGRFVVSVDSDTTHSLRVPGQRIGVALLHTSR